MAAKHDGSLADNTKIPKSLAAVADLYYVTREKRKALDKQAAEIKELESKLRQHLIDNIAKSDSTGVMGKVCTAKIVPKSTPRVTDWDSFYSYVIKKKAFHLLQKRLSESSINDIIDQGGSVPGVEIYTYKDVSIGKVK